MMPVTTVIPVERPQPTAMAQQSYFQPPSQPIPHASDVKEAPAGTKNEMWKRSLFCVILT